MVASSSVASLSYFYTLLATVFMFFLLKLLNHFLENSFLKISIPQILLSNY